MVKKDFLSTIVVVAILITIVYIIVAHKMWTNENRVVFWDVKSYYAYLPSIIIHGDPFFDFVDEYPEIYGDKFWLETAENGNKYIITPMGMAMLYSPFFLGGHLWAHITGAATTGYSTPYFFALLLSSVFYLILGFIFLRKILLIHFSDKITAVTLALVFFGTNLLWYSTFEATMTHAYSFALFSLFVYFTIRWHQHPNILNSLLTGIIIGLITVVRPTNSIIALFFIFYDIKSIKDIYQKFNFFVRHSKLILVIAIFSFMAVLPQLVYWKYITGNWIINSYGDKGIFYFTNPQILNGLFSYRKGWFIYTPIMFIAFISIPLLFKADNLKRYFSPVIVFKLLNIYIVLSWWIWWYGGSYGLRPFIESYAIMAIPLAASLDIINKKKIIFKIPAFVVVAFLALYGLFGNIQYYYGAIHWDSMTKEAYWNSFLRAKPSADFYNLIKAPDYSKPSEIIHVLFNDAENIDLNKNLFITEVKNMYFDGVPNLTQDKAFSGKYSIKLNSKQPFGFTTAINSMLSDHTYLISVKRYSEKNNGYLIMQTDDMNLLYRHQSIGTPILDTYWQEINLELKVTPELAGKKLKIYCHNPYENDVFFDDILIRVIKN